MDQIKIAKRAKEIFQNGVCCSEAIVYAIAEAYDAENAAKYMRLASGLCGGLGAGEICGIISGGACAIGLAFGRDDLVQAPKVKASLISKQLLDLFNAEFKHVQCAALKESTPAKYASTRDYCADMLEHGTEIAVKLINENA